MKLSVNIIATKLNDMIYNYTDLAPDTPEEKEVSRKRFSYRMRRIRLYKKSGGAYYEN